MRVAVRGRCRRAWASGASAPRIRPWASRAHRSRSSRRAFPPGSLHARRDGLPEPHDQPVAQGWARELGRRASVPPKAPGPPGPPRARGSAAPSAPGEPGGKPIVRGGALAPRCAGLALAATGVVPAFALSGGAFVSRVGLHSGVSAFAFCTCRLARQRNQSASASGPSLPSRDRAWTGCRTPPAVITRRTGSGVESGSWSTCTAVESYVVYGSSFWVKVRLSVTESWTVGWREARRRRVVNEGEDLRHLAGVGLHAHAVERLARVDLAVPVLVEPT